MGEVECECCPVFALPHSHDEHADNARCAQHLESPFQEARALQDCLLSLEFVRRTMATIESLLRRLFLANFRCALGTWPSPSLKKSESGTTAIVADGGGDARQDAVTRERLLPDFAKWRSGPDFFIAPCAAIGSKQSRAPVRGRRPNIRSCAAVSSPSNPASAPSECWAGCPITVFSATRQQVLQANREPQSYELLYSDIRKFWRHRDCGMQSEAEVLVPTR